MRPHLADGPLGFAHRGARAHAPENTLEAFVLAQRMGATAIESDAWLTADGIAVLDHDGVVRGSGRRTTPIAHLLHRDLPGHIPTLAELYEACGTDLQLSLDIKDPHAAPEVLRVAAAQGPGVVSRLWLCDPHPHRLASWKRLAPEVRLVASVRQRRLAFDPRCRLPRLVDAGIEVVNLHGDTWTPGAVRRCHDAGLATFAWGVQWSPLARLLLRWGLDGIYSDHVDRLTGWIRA